MFASLRGRYRAWCGRLPRPLRLIRLLRFRLLVVVRAMIRCDRFRASTLPHRRLLRCIGTLDSRIYYLHGVVRWRTTRGRSRNVTRLVHKPNDDDCRANGRNRHESGTRQEGPKRRSSHVAVPADSKGIRGLSRRVLLAM